jgi:hypothetical protein
MRTFNKLKENIIAKEKNRALTDLNLIKRLHVTAEVLLFLVQAISNGSAMLRFFISS